MSVYKIKATHIVNSMFNPNGLVSFKCSKYSSCHLVMLQAVLSTFISVLYNASSMYCCIYVGYLCILCAFCVQSRGSFELNKNSTSHNRSMESISLKYHDNILQPPSRLSTHIIERTIKLLPAYTQTRRINYIIWLI